LGHFQIDALERLDGTLVTDVQIYNFYGQMIALISGRPFRFF